MEERHTDLSKHQNVSLGGRLTGMVTVGSAATGFSLLLVELFGVTWAFVGPFTFQPLPALVAVGGVVAGPVAVMGTVVGYLCYQFVYGVPALWETAAYFLLGMLAVLFWHDAYLGDSAVKSYLRFTVVAATASLWAATLVTWGLELTGQARFFPTFVFFTGDALLSTLTLGSVAYVVFARFARGHDGRLSSLRRVQPLFGGSQRTVPELNAELAAIPFVWFLFGSSASIAFQLLELVPRFHLRLRGLGFLAVFKRTALFGEGGSTVIVTGGAVCLALLIPLLRRRRNGRSHR